MATRFELGRLLATPGVLEAVEAAGDDLLIYVARHAAGDWGTVDDDDREANEQELAHGARLLSAYLLRDGTKFWIITEADRASTTVLLPEEY